MRGMRYGERDATNGALSGLTKEEVHAKLAIDMAAYEAAGGDVQSLPYLMHAMPRNQNVLQALRVQRYGDRWGDYKDGDVLAMLEGRAYVTIVEQEAMISDGN